ncbi:hypothetical protein ABK040_015233 [Willaertia magna]
MEEEIENQKRALEQRQKVFEKSLEINLRSDIIDICFNKCILNLSSSSSFNNTIVTNNNKLLNQQQKECLANCSVKYYQAFASVTEIYAERYKRELTK